MAAPEIKLIAVSNVYSRLMHFKAAGDVEVGHTHPYDHATLVSSGSVRVDLIHADGTIEASNTFTAPSMVFIQKDRRHKITAIEDNTVCACIHALRTIDSELVGPDCMVNQVNGGGGNIKNAVAAHAGKQMQPLVG